jgi:hypothetical protein
MTETWKPVVGFEGFYEVSDCGRARTINRSFLRRHNKTDKMVLYSYRGRVCKTWMGTETGYQMIDLNANGRAAKRAVHVLVLEAFIGPRPKGCVACHNDGSRTNNALTNLRWDTYEGNERDKLRHGTHMRGTRNHVAKLTEEDVLKIRASDEKQQALADRYGVTQVCISRIKLRKVWAWLNA